jgi:hypothetical protein
MVAFGAVVSKIASPTLAAKSIVHGNRFQQGGFSRAILACKKTDTGSQLEFLKLPDGRNAEGITVPVRYAIAQKRDGFEH